MKKFTDKKEDRNVFILADLQRFDQRSTIVLIICIMMNLRTMATAKVCFAIDSRHSHFTPPSFDHQTPFIVVFCGNDDGPPSVKMLAI